MDNFWGEHHSDPDNLEITESPKKLTNLVELPDGRYRAYKTENNKKKYIGTFNSKEEAINAQIEYALNNVLPPRKRKNTKDIKLDSLVNEFFNTNGLPENE